MPQRRRILGHLLYYINRHLQGVNVKYAQRADHSWILGEGGPTLLPKWDPSGLYSMCTSVFIARHEISKSKRCDLGNCLIESLESEAAWVEPLDLPLDARTNQTPGRLQQRMPPLNYPPAALYPTRENVMIDAMFQNIVPTVGLCSQHGSLKG